MSQISLPNGRVLMDVLKLTPERLWSGSKIALPLSFVRILLNLAISQLPFDEEFYMAMYPDLAAAHNTGQISDLKTHFAEQGYFEGRFGIRPSVDEEFYKKTYRDVADAVDLGQLSSGYDHYVKIGASEGRFANAEEMAALQSWLDVLAIN